MLLDKLEFGLVAFKTDDGVFYVRPSGWQRLYLLWTFRHFHKLQVRLLNRRQRRLVEHLYRSGSARLSGRQERTHIIGGIEDADQQFSRLDVRITRRPHHELPKPLLIPVARNSVTQKSNQTTVSETTVRTVAEPLLRRSQPVYATLAWSKIGQTVGVGALCVLVATSAWHRLQASANSHVANAQKSVQAYLPTPVNAAPQSEVAPMAFKPVSPMPALQLVGAPNDPAPIENHTVPVTQPVTPPASALLPAKPPSHDAATPSALVARASQTAPITSAPAHHNPLHDETAHVSTIASLPATETEDEASLPNVSRSPMKLVYPSAPESDLRGSVALQAMLGADGNVEKVRIISGNPVLANAAIRAVRQWHYAPYYKDGHALETETNIRISFIASDAISISFPASAATPH